MPIIQKATAADIPQLNKISWASKSYWNYPTGWMERWREGLMLQKEQLETSSVFKIWDDQEIFGFCLINEEEEYYEVEHLWILPAYIGKGYGKQLLEESLKRAVVNNKPIQVEADPNAEAFYARRGFVTFGQKESYPKGRFLPLMKRENL